MKKSAVSVLAVGMFGIALSAQDATRGGALYKQQCVSCHGEGLEGRSGPPLTGGDFRSRWPASDLTDKIRNTMPQNSPGTLNATQAADLTAYIQQAGKGATNGGAATVANAGPPVPFPHAVENLRN